MAPSCGTSCLRSITRICVHTDLLAGTKQELVCSDATMHRYADNLHAQPRAVQHFISTGAGISAQRLAAQ